MFISISGSDFVEMFVGVGASRVRDMFEQGKKPLRIILLMKLMRLEEAEVQDWEEEMMKESKPSINYW